MTGFPSQPLTPESVAVSEDADELWRAFLDASHARDHALADAIRARLTALQRSRTAADFDDDQLMAQIITLRHEALGDHPCLVEEHVEEAEDAGSDAGWERRARYVPAARDRLVAEDLTALLEEARRRGLET